MSEREDFELDRDKTKWLIKTRLTLVSVLVIFFTLCFYLIVPAFYLDTEQVSSLKEFNSITITLVGAFVSIILAFIGVKKEH